MNNLLIVTWACSTGYPIQLSGNLIIDISLIEISLFQMWRRLLWHRLSTLRSFISITILLPCRIGNLLGRVHLRICTNRLVSVFLALRILANDFGLIGWVCSHSFYTNHLAIGGLAVAQHLLLLVPAVIQRWQWSAVHRRPIWSLSHGHTVGSTSLPALTRWIMNILGRLDLSIDCIRSAQLFGTRILI